MNRLSLAVLFGATVAAGCEEPVTVTQPVLNLDRPVDISFACFGDLKLMSEAGQPTISSAQPRVSCERLSPQLDTEVPATALPGQDGLDPPVWFGFILQSGPGTVALATWPAKAANVIAPSEFEVLDADPLTPGKNAIGVGEEPIAIGADTSGCYQVTANAGSCDMSILDVNSAVDGNTATPIVVTRRPVTSGTGAPIRARPAAMVVAPGTNVVGNACPTTPTGVAYVAYPSCHLVAAVDLATGSVVAGIQFDAAGVATVVDGSAVSCRDECAAAGPATTPGTRPVALDLALDRPDPATTTRRLAIGADNQAAITVVDLDAGFRPVTTAPLQIPLENQTGGKLGVTSIALSPRIAMGGSTGNNDATPGPAGEGQYVYAVTTDDTVRVADVLGLRRECDTQVDPRFLRGQRPVATLQCLPIGDPASPRRVGARGPGIEIPTNGVPTSVAIIKGLDLPLLVPMSNVPGKASATTLIGYFGLISSSSGATYVVNIDHDWEEDAFSKQDPLATSPSLIIAHQLRDSFLARGRKPPSQNVRCDVGNPAPPDPMVPADEKLPLETPVTGMGGPRGGIPLNNARGGVPNVISGDKSLGLPILHQVACAIPTASDAGAPVAEVQFAAPESVRDEVFPDLAAVQPEQWTLTWEGPLSRDGIQTAIDGPIIRTAQMRVDETGMFLTDPSRPYCDMGVEPYDYVQFRGCDPTGGGDCPAGYECFVHPQSQLASGACILRSEASRLSNACRDFLTSLRHYTIGRAASGALTLMPRKRVLRTTPVAGCTIEPSTDPRTSPQCEALADYAAKAASPNNPISDPTPPDPRTWKCMADDTRRPLSTNPLTLKNWCVQTCATSTDCDANTICQAGVCMEGVVPPQACVNGPQRYEVHAGDAFTVLGSRSGFVHPIVADSSQGGLCIRDPNAHPLQVGRVPLTAPACNAAPADPFTDLLPNPCLLTVTQTERRPNYLNPETCELPPPPTLEMPNPPPQVVVDARANTSAIKLRTRSVTFTLVDPTYPGDARCILDRRGFPGVPAEGVPLVFPNYQIGFNQAAAFDPLELSFIQPIYPVKVVRGPANSIWVIDDGDFLATRLGDPSTAGAVYRIDPVALSAFALLQ
jgi:hypothetical protein